MTAGPSKPLPSYMRPTSASQAMKKVHTASDAVECCASASRWIFWPCLAAALSNERAHVKANVTPGREQSRTWAACSSVEPPAALCNARSSTPLSPVPVGCVADLDRLAKLFSAC